MDDKRKIKQAANLVPNSKSTNEILSRLDPKKSQQANELMQYLAQAAATVTSFKNFVANVKARHSQIGGGIGGTRAEFKIKVARIFNDFNLVVLSAKIDPDGVLEDINRAFKESGKKIE